MHAVSSNIDASGGRSDSPPRAASSLRGLDWLNFFLADVQTGVGPFLAIYLAGRKAFSWGRKPVLLIAFAVLPIRGLLYTLTHQVALLIAIQLLDGVAAGIFGVVSVLVIADLTRGTGRFNLTQGLIATAVGIGASLSQSIAGAIVKHHGYNVGFTSLAMVAAIALGIFWTWMPETRRSTTPRGDLA